MAAILECTVHMYMYSSQIVERLRGNYRADMNKLTQIRMFVFDKDRHDAGMVIHLGGPKFSHRLGGSGFESKLDQHHPPAPSPAVCTAGGSHTQTKKVGY